MTDIVKLHRRCELGIAEAQLWSDRLAADALAAEPGPAQRFAVLGTHALDTIASLWESRLPSIPVDTSTELPTEHTQFGEYLNSLRAEIQSLDAATDPDVDPSTRRMCKRIIFEIDLLRDEADRTGVAL